MGDLVQRRCQPFEQPATLLGRRDAPCGARQQANPKARLEAADGVADGRRRHAEFSGGPAKTAMGGNGGQYRELRELRSVH
ncbi:hypothetical protein D9M72_528580 [compost metagenome]